MRNISNPIIRCLISAIVAGAVLSVAANSWAQDNPRAMDPKVKEICNQVIRSIYFDILDQKDAYETLKNFDERVMYESKDGVYAIMYEAGRPSAGDTARRPYRLGLTFEPAGQSVFPIQEDSFVEEYPALGVRLNGYQNQYLLKSEFDVRPLVKQYSRALADYQQEHIPLRLFLQPVKDTYNVREDIEFEVILQNVSKRNMIVKGLGANTLFFLFNDKYWGTRPTANQKGGKDVVLLAGKSLRMKFKGESFQEPKRIQIFGVYRMSVGGVNPYGTLDVDIVEK